MSYCIDLVPFFEVSAIKPLLQNDVVTFGESKFNVDRIFRDGGNSHCYVLIDQANDWKPFAKKPSEIVSMIKAGKLIITSQWVLSQLQNTKN